MKLNVLYFAALRESFGCPAESVSVPEDVRTVGALRDWLGQRGDAWQHLLGPSGNARAAVNQAMASESTALHENAEVAFFPPVTGG